MNILESFFTGIQNIWSHKLQSFLTMLGVIFGVAAVISMVSIGEGAREEAVRQLQSLGTNQIIIRRLEPAVENIKTEHAKSPYGLHHADGIQLAQICPYIEEYASVREVRSGYIGTLGGPGVQASVIGATEELPQVIRMVLEAGRFLSAEDMGKRNLVCVLGSETKKKLFSFHEAVGRNVQINEDWYTCVGVLEPHQGSTLIKTTDQNNAIYIPLSTSVQNFTLTKTVENLKKAQENSGPNREFFEALSVAKYPFPQAPLSEIILKIDDISHIADTENLVRRILLKRHRQIENFEIIIPTELLRQSQKTQQMFNIIMAAIAGISLLVGGIGIMNIMLATVTQRTREIGIRRCLGATKLNILIQFMMESLIITLCGGLMGVALGFLLAKSISAYAHWQTVISYTAVFYALGVATSVGVIFGLYPAWKAASVDPIRALKYE